MKTENYFPAGISGKVLIVGAAESFARVLSMGLGKLADTTFFWLAATVILCISTTFPERQSPLRTWVFAIGLTAAALGGVYLFDSRFIGWIGLFIGYTVGCIILFTAHMLADKDLDRWNGSTPSPFGRAGGVVMILLSILALVACLMRASALLQS